MIACSGPGRSECQWGEWSGWSLCSISCGEGGQRKRFRLLTREIGGKPCNGETSEVAACPVYSCPKMKDFQLTGKKRFVTRFSLKHRETQFSSSSYFCIPLYPLILLLHLLHSASSSFLICFIIPSTSITFSIFNPTSSTFSLTSSFFPLFSLYPFPQITFLHPTSQF